jgi:hypothetical protein
MPLDLPPNIDAQCKVFTSKHIFYVKKVSQEELNAVLNR